MHKKSQSQRNIPKIKPTSPQILPSHRNPHQRTTTMSQFSEMYKKPQLSRCGSMGLPELQDKLFIIEQDISTTQIETISLEKLHQWCNALLEQCQQMTPHKYAFKVVSHTNMIQRQIDDEIHNREKLKEQTQQMMNYNEQEIHQLLSKIDVLEKQLYK